jgi:Homeodomain-like domain
MISKEKRDRAIILRKDGMSLDNIAKELGIAKSTVLGWIKGIVLTDEQYAKLKTRKGKGNPNLPFKRSEFYREKRLQYQEEGRKLIQEVWFRDLCMLYWAEGSKRRSSVVFSNCDEDMLLYFISCFKKINGYKSEKICIRVGAYEGEEINIKKYWSDFLNLPITSIRQVQYLENKNNNKYNKYSNGCLRFEYNDVRFIQMIYGGIQAAIGVNKASFYW